MLSHFIYVVGKILKGESQGKKVFKGIARDAGKESAISTAEVLLHTLRLGVLGFFCVWFAFQPWVLLVQKQNVGH